MVWRFPSRALAVAALLGVATLQGHMRVDPGTAGTRLNDAWLVAAVGAARIVEPRLTGGFAYAPWMATAPTDDATMASARSSDRAAALSSAGDAARDGTDTATVARPVPSSRLYTAAARIEKLAQADPRPERLRALGVAYLLLGRPEQAIDTLERALVAAPDDPRTLSDLSAALLVQSPASEDTWDAVRALNYAERAWRKAPDLPEAAFNAALARERMHLRSEARKAWLAVQRLDPHGAWASEAARHITALSAETVAQVWPRVKEATTDSIAAGQAIDAADLARRFPQAIREYLQEDLLPAWGAAHLAGDALTATRRLAAADALCRALARDGDGTCLRTLARIAAASATIEPPRVRTSAAAAAPASASDQGARLAAAHRDFGAAMKLFREHRFAESERLFTDARSGFVRGDSPEAAWCDAFLSIIDYRLSHLARSSTRLRTAAASLTSQDLALRGRFAWQVGLNEIATEQYTRALAEYEQARDAFRAAHEQENGARIDLLLAEALSNLGNRREAWQLYDTALDKIQNGHNLVARQAVLVGAAIRANDQELTSAALVFANEFLSSEDARNEPVALIDILLNRFLTLAQLGDMARAREDLLLARRTLDRVRDATMQQRLAAEINFREGRMFAAMEPERAIPALTTSLDQFGALGLDNRLPAVLRVRGQAYGAKGNEGAARADLLHGMEALQNRARDLADEPLRASARETVWPFFADLIRMDLDRDRPLQALAFAERAKSYGLSDGVALCQDRQPASVAQCWAAHVPQALTVIHYVVLDDELAIWVIASDGIQFVRHPIRRTELRARIADYRVAIEGRRTPEQMDAAGAALFDHLVGPIQARIAAESDLLVIPDDTLYGLPFGALIDRARHRYVVEDHLVMVAPSFTHFLLGTQRTAGLAMARASKAVVITSPTTSGVVSATLPTLPGADAEARQMARLLPEVDVLKERQATKAHLRAALVGADILHIASHARVNYRTPWRSYFLLAPDDGRSGEEFLFMWELSSLPLQRLGLAVLAACGSADGPVAGGSGALSLAYPFLSAGVPNVIASLWPVDDRATHVLFSAFYTHLSQGASPEDALRLAQLAMLRGHDTDLRHPASWAPFVAMGGRSGASTSKRGTT